MKLSYSFVDEEIVDIWSGVSDMADAVGEISVWVMPRIAVGIRPAWGRGGYEVGIDIELELVGVDIESTDEALISVDKRFISIEPYLKLRLLKKGRYHIAPVIAFPSLLPRVYLVADYELNERFAFYSSLFLDHRGLFGQGRPIGVGLLAGVGTKSFLAELGAGWYRDYGIHPFIGVGFADITNKDDD